MHTIQTTEGFILKSINFGEANKYYFIFTAKFGLIKASAQGVRHLKSKLRFNLKDFAFGQISLVRGREIWRITSAETNSYISEKEKDKFLLISRIYSLLLRLLHGEEKNDLLFKSLQEGVSYLINNDLSAESLSNFECIMALKILSNLGYVGKLGDFDQFTESPYFNPELLTNMSTLKSKAILEINKSLKETHL